MYTEQAWPFLDQLLVEAARGDSGGLWDAKDSGHGPDGEDANTRPDENDPQFVINCSDRPERLDERATRATARRLARLSPTFGVLAGGWLVGCGAWPEGEGLAEPTTSTTTPLLVVGSTGDPATPYSGAVTLARLLGDGTTLLTREGQGHTSFLTGNECVDDVVTTYLLTVAPPEADTRC